jgi:hypothetical protein
MNAESKELNALSILIGNISKFEAFFLQLLVRIIGFGLLIRRTVNIVHALAFRFHMEFVISPVNIKCVIDISHNSIFL